MPIVELSPTSKAVTAVLICPAVKNTPRSQSMSTPVARNCTALCDLRTSGKLSWFEVVMKMP